MATTYDQLAQVPLANDEVFKNYSTTTAIEANVVVAIDTTNYVGDSNGTTIPGIVLPSVGGDPTLCVGITLEKIRAGQSGRVRTLGIAYAKFYAASGTLAAGVTVDASATASHAGEIAAHTAGKASLGQTRSAASAPGDMVLVFVNPSLNA